MNQICQSCAIPLKKDPELGGTNADGSKSIEYCSRCYQQGSFTRPNFTAKEMQTLCIQKMIELKFPRLIAWIFTRNIPKLNRWAKKA